MHHLSTVPLKCNIALSTALSCEKRYPPPQIVDFKEFNYFLRSKQKDQSPKSKVFLLAFCLFLLGSLPPLGGGGAAQNIGISTDATAPETGLMLDIKAPSGYAKTANNSAQPFFQIKSFDTDATALKLRLGLRTDATQSNRYGFMEFFEAGTPTYLPLALQPSGGNVGIGTTAPVATLHLSAATGLRLNSPADDVFPAITVATRNTGGEIRAEAGQNSNYGTLILSAGGESTLSTKMSLVLKGDGATDVAQARFLSGNAPLMTIHSSGNVGIGTTAPAYALDVVGQTRCTNGVWLTSDIQFKKEIKPIESSLSNLVKLQGVSYKWKAEEFKELKFTNTLQYGVIAQELEKIYPEMINTDEKGYKAVNYTMLTPVLIEAVKELSAEVRDLSLQNQEQLKRIFVLEKEMENLKMMGKK